VAAGKLPREFVRQLDMDREVSTAQEESSREQRAEDVVGDNDVDGQKRVASAALMHSGLDLHDQRGRDRPAAKRCPRRCHCTLDASDLASLDQNGSPSRLLTRRQNSSSNARASASPSLIRARSVKLRKWKRSRTRR